MAPKMVWRFKDLSTGIDVEVSCVVYEADGRGTSFTAFLGPSGGHTSTPIWVVREESPQYERRVGEVDG